MKEVGSSLEVGNGIRMGSGAKIFCAAKIHYRLHPWQHHGPGDNSCHYGIPPLYRQTHKIARSLARTKIMDFWPFCMDDRAAQRSSMMAECHRLKESARSHGLVARYSCAKSLQWKKIGFVSELHC